MQFTPIKPIIIWIPPSLDATDVDNKLSLLISNIDAVPINTSLYKNTKGEDSFRVFYDREIRKYDDRIDKTTFCAAAETSGVSRGYLINTANDSNTATILSVNMDETGGISDVYALLSFHISHKKVAVRIDTLCGNQVLPSSGEGTRLLKILEKASYHIGINKIALDPLPNAIPFYQQNKYRFLEENDSSVTNSSDSFPDSPDSTDSSDVLGPMIQMQKNIAAQKRWNIIKTYVNMNTRLKTSKNKTELRVLQQTNKLIHDDELQRVRENLDIRRARSGVPKEGKPINPPGSSLKTRGTRIIPGNTLMIKQDEKQTRKTQKKDTEKTNTKITKRRHRKRTS
jgi:hypothetical protein